jgi:hypothetical protein
MADGSIRQADPVETATVLFNLVSWTYRHLRQGHGWPPSGRARACSRSPGRRGGVKDD